MENQPQIIKFNLNIIMHNDVFLPFIHIPDEVFLHTCFFSGHRSEDGIPDIPQD